MAILVDSSLVCWFAPYPPQNGSDGGRGGEGGKAGLGGDGGDIVFVGSTDFIELSRHIKVENNGGPNGTPGMAGRSGKGGLGGKGGAISHYCGGSVYPDAADGATPPQTPRTPEPTHTSAVGSIIEVELDSLD